jgi:hypothetical protein
MRCEQMAAWYQSPPSIKRGLSRAWQDSQPSEAGVLLEFGAVSAELARDHPAARYNVTCGCSGWLESARENGVPNAVRSRVPHRSIGC